jgi:uncharacterized membrane protein
MTESFALGALVYVHLVSMALWFGGLFGYLVVVWPAIMSEANGEFPRALLAKIGMRTAIWIYLAMALALLSVAALSMIDAVYFRGPLMLGYALLLGGLVLNNVYGSAVAWPRIMLLPETSARQEWFWFRARMSVALVVGLTLYSVVIIATLLLKLT